VTGFTLEGLLGRRGKLLLVGESESHSAREKMLQDELYLLCRHPLNPEAFSKPKSQILK